MAIVYKEILKCARLALYLHVRCFEYHKIIIITNKNNEFVVCGYFSASFILLIDEFLEKVSHSTESRFTKYISWTAFYKIRIIPR